MKLLKNLSLLTATIFMSVGLCSSSTILANQTDNEVILFKNDRNKDHVIFMSKAGNYVVGDYFYKTDFKDNTSKKISYKDKGVVSTTVKHMKMQYKKYKIPLKYKNMTPKQSLRINEINKKIYNQLKNQR